MLYINANTHTCTHIYPCIHTHVHVGLRTYIHTMDTYIYSLRNSCMRTCIHAFTQAYVNTYTCMHIHMAGWNLLTSHEGRSRGGVEAHVIIYRTVGPFDSRQLSLIILLIILHTSLPRYSSP